MTRSQSLPAPDETLWMAFERALDACGVTPAQRNRALARTFAKHGKIVAGQVDMYALDTFSCALLDETGDLSLGVRLGLSMGRGSTGVIEYAMLTAPSLRAAHRVYARLGALVDEYVHYEVEDTAGYARIRLSPPGELPLNRLLEDYRTMRLVSALRRAFASPEYAPTALCFTYPKPSDLTPLLEAVGRHTDLRFAQPHTALRLPASDLDRPLAESDPLLHEILLHSATELLSQRPTPTSVAAKVHQTLTASLHRGRPSLQEVARSLGLGERTLRRRLADEGTSFGEVLDDVRRRMLDVLGPRRAHDAKAVATQLGFQSVRALRRAEARWKGLPSR